MSLVPTVAKEFRSYKRVAERALTQVSDEHLHWQPDKDSNSIAILMKHLSGNILSRWTDFLTSDGEKPSRDRDAEFVSGAESRDELMASWERAWSSLFDTLNSLTDADLEKTVYIRGEPQTVTRAIVRQLAHYALHIGQIIYIAKHLRKEEWQTLSMPRGQSAAGTPPPHRG